MQRRPITFDEKVDARFVRRGQTECWRWDGNLKEGRPTINTRHVIRYIYEREIAPIPPGMVLVRRDHRPYCFLKRDVPCQHMQCVNPYHVIPRPGKIYQRERPSDLTSSERAAEWKRTYRQKRRNKEKVHGDQAEPTDTKSMAPDRNEGSDIRVGMEKPDEAESGCCDDHREGDR